jgi:hypothetical protein
MVRNTWILQCVLSTPVADSREALSLAIAISPVRDAFLARDNISLSRWRSRRDPARHEPIHFEKTPEPSCKPGWIDDE